MSKEQQAGVLQPIGPMRSRAMRRVLVCLDRSPTSEGCLPVAVSLAKSFESILQLIHVLECDSASRAASPDAVDWLMARTEAEEYLAKVVARLTAHDLPCRAVVMEGHVAEQILCTADREDHDLIVLTSHGEKGVTEWSLGSTTEKVLARARASVLMVPAGSLEEHPGGEASLGRILILLDGSPRAEGILPPLERLARERSSVLVLLHVATPPQLFESCPPTADDADLRCRLEARNERGARQYLVQIGARLTREGFTVQEIVEKGDPRAILPLIAAREKIDLIAMTSHGRTGDRSRCFGDTAAHMLRNAKAPILMLQNLPQQTSDFAEAVRHRREAAPLRGSHSFESA